jgi:hypothetical protein
MYVPHNLHPNLGNCQGSYFCPGGDPPINIVYAQVASRRRVPCSMAWHYSFCCSEVARPAVVLGAHALCVCVCVYVKFLVQTLSPLSRTRPNATSTNQETAEMQSSISVSFEMPLSPSVSACPFFLINHNNNRNMRSGIRFRRVASRFIRDASNASGGIESHSTNFQNNQRND